ncbi:MAG: RDD family protein [Acidobacteriia bacterium]|nr:RDD family protein [Terriglobia bacterium]
MFCSRCGQNVSEGNRFCQNCGQEVGVAAPAAQAAPPLPNMGSVSGPLVYGGFWLRFVAYLIDGVILGIPFGLVVMVLFVMFGGFGLMMHRRVGDPRAAAAFLGPMFLGFLFAMLLFVGLQWLYFAGLESSERQATFGKSAMSLRVTDLQGQRLSFGHATGRFFSKIITGLIPLGIGYIMAGFTEKKQALHDMIAGTLVVRKL